MFDPILTLAALLHVCALAGLTVYACRRLGMARQDMPVVLYVALWAALVLGAHGASLLHMMDRLYVYAPMTFAGLALMLGAMAWTGRGERYAVITSPRLSFADIDHPRARLYLKRFLIGTLALAALCSAVIVFSVYPDNADSMIYRLPRAFWYVSHGSFLHPFDAIDKRLTYYPLDGVALYVPLVLYNLVGTAHGLPSLVTWAMLVYLAYRFAREIGAEPLIALAAAWMIGMVPGVIAQSMSTNDEILCATAVLAGLYLGWRWLVTGDRSLLFLGATAIGISTGTKLHILFLLPIIGLAFLFVVRAALKNPTLWSVWSKAIGMRTAILSTLSVTVMVVPFLLYNVASSGHFYFSFAGDVFNLDHDPQTILQNALIYLSQMIFSPFADLNVWPNAAVRQSFNNALNGLTTPLIAPFLSLDPKHYHMAYRFVGVTLPVSVRFLEFSLWPGFIWLLWPWQIALAWRQTSPFRPVFVLLAMTPILWMALWCGSTLYMEGTATYFTYYLIVAAPAMVFAFAKIRMPMWNEMRWATLAVVALTSLVIVGNMFMFSGFRALPDIVNARSWPVDWDIADPPVIDELRRADAIRIVQIHEKTPFFALMHWNPRARYYTPYMAEAGTLPPSDRMLQILTVASNYVYGFMPLKIVGKATPGLTYLGTYRAIGREVIFALGNGVERRHPDQSDYILFHLGMPEQSAPGQPIPVHVESAVAGLNTADGLEVRYSVTLNDQVVHETDWSSDPEARLLVPPVPGGACRLTIAVRNVKDHKEVARATYQLGGPGAWLPEEGEY